MVTRSIGHLGWACPIHIVAYSVLKLFFGSESLYLISRNLLGVMFNYISFLVMVLLSLICTCFSVLYIYIYMVPFDRIKMSSFMSSKYFSYNVRHMAQGVSMA
jgi:hypothetical protein